jgi:hypothetical protein
MDRVRSIHATRDVGRPSYYVIYLT